MEISFSAMGTSLTIRIWDKIDDMVFNKIKIEILDFTNYFDSTYSRFQENSLVTQISKNLGTYKVEKDFTEILKMYFLLNELTHGSINPLLGHTISDLGYDTTYTLRPKEEIRQTPDLKKTLEVIDEVTIKTNDKVLTDIGAIGKGFWVDKVVEILKKNNLKKFLVDGSGDIYFCNLLDEEKLKVELKSPCLAGVSTQIYNQAICGSGTDLRNWSVNKGENLHHVIDAVTSLPTDNIISTWAIADTCMLSDGLATCLFFLDAKTLAEKLNEFNFSAQFSSLTIDKNKKVSFYGNFKLI